MKAPILKIVDPDKDFIVCTDASKDDLGVILTQEDHVISYKYKKLKEHEKNYVVHDMELKTIIHALKIWQHYFMGKNFLLSIDNIILKYLSKHKTLNAWQSKCLAFLSENNFGI